MILEGVSVNRGSIIFLSVAVLGLASCDRASDAVSDTISDAIVDTVSVDPTRDVATLLERNDPAACANQTAIDTALAVAHRDYTSYIENGGQRLRVDTVSATAVDKDIHEITCSSMIHYRMTNDDEFSLPFRFKLRPMLGNGPRNFVAEAFGGREAWAAVMWHMAWWKNQPSGQASETTAAAEIGNGTSRQESSSSTEEMQISRTNDGGYRDDCLIVIRGKQQGGRKCQADSNGRSTFYLTNEAGVLEYYPDESSKKIWSASWKPEGGNFEDIGSLEAEGKCLRNVIATIC